MSEKRNGGTFGPIIVCVIALLLFLSSCGGGGSSRDVVHDPDGFLGYSDSFWEWQAKQ